MSKVKFNDLVGNKQVLKSEELAVLQGGIGYFRSVYDAVGCDSGVCVEGRDVGARYCTDGDGVCGSGIGSCHGKT